MTELKHGGCVSCWRWACWLTQLYSHCDGTPITKVGEYHYRHWQHQQRLANGLSWHEWKHEAWPWWRLS